MSTDITTKRMTAEEFCDWVHQPERANRWFELVRGEVIELPPPMKPHGVVAVRVGRILGNFAEEAGKGYLTSNDSGVILERDPDTVRGPDIAYYEDATTFEELHPKYGEVPPRLAVEILSPTDRAKQVTRKITDYLNNGVELVWLLDPEDRLVTVYRPDKKPVILQGDQQLTAEPVLPGFRCLVSEFFRLPGEKATPPRAKPKSGRRPPNGGDKPRRSPRRP
jgi:Uma2 family endonuclease